MALSPIIFLYSIFSIRIYTTNQINRMNFDLGICVSRKMRIDVGRLKDTYLISLSVTYLSEWRLIHVRKREELLR